MKNKTRQVTLLSRAAEVRGIAKGIFDKVERSAVLRLVAEYVKLSKATIILRNCGVASCPIQCTNLMLLTFERTPPIRVG